MSAASTTLALPGLTNVLTKLFDTTQETAVCAVCTSPLDDGMDTFLICRFPDMLHGSDTMSHEGHTACATCASDPCLYIGQGGSCGPCLKQMGGLRSSVVRAGVALRPPVKNSLASMMLKNLNSAKKEVGDMEAYANEMRMQEGPRRRADAVETVRANRSAREAEEQERLRVQAVEQGKEDARREARIQEEVRVAALESENAAKVAALESARAEAVEEARAASAAKDAALAAATSVQALAVAGMQAPDEGSSSRKRPRKKATPEARKARLDAANRARAIIKHKVKTYDRIHAHMKELRDRAVTYMSVNHADERVAFEALMDDPELWSFDPEVVDADDQAVDADVQADDADDADDVEVAD
jgi:hypothetical protein